MSGYQKISETNKVGGKIASEIRREGQWFAWGKRKPIAVFEKKTEPRRIRT